MLNRKCFTKIALTVATMASAAYGQLGGGMASSGGGMGGFGGPAVLGRGAGSTTGTRGVSELGIRFYAGVTGTIDSGLTGLRVDSNGNLQNFSSKGVEGTFGVYGTKRFKRGTMGINYSSSYRQYANQAPGSNFNGTDQSFGIFTSRQLSPRSGFQFSSSIGTSNRAFGLPGLGGLIDPNIGAVVSPTADLFDNRFYFGNGTVGYTYQKSARTSMSVFGTGFLVRRTGSALYGSNGTTTGADIAYRISRTQTIHVGYNFFFFNFTRNFGDTNAHGVNVGYSQLLGRKFTFNARVGANKLEILGVKSVSVDPVIAALVGFSSTSVVFYNKPILPNASIGLSGPVTKRSNFSITGGIQPGLGNGVINNTKNYTLGGGYNYTGLRLMSISAGSNYLQMSSVDGMHQQFRTIQSTVNVSRRLRNDIFFNVSGGNRKFLSTSFNNFQKSSFYGSIGFFYSPGELPLAIR